MFERIVDVETWVTELAALPRDLSDAERIDRIRHLEELKAAAAAAQAVLTTDFVRSQRRAQADAGVPARRRGEGIEAQVALARRDSPHQGARHVGLAHVLVAEMPNLLALLRRGLLSERRATLLARETACLSLEDRRTVDTTLCADPATLDGLGDRAIVAAAKRLAYRLDPESVVRRARRAESERTVTIRPAPDTMTYVTGLLPVAHGVAVHAALSREADRLRAAGDPRSRGQLMADTLVARVTRARGDEGATDPAATTPPVQVTLVITDRTLFGGESEPAHLQGHGPVPAQWARDLVRAGLDTGDQPTRVFLKRLGVDPATGRVVSLDSRSRHAPAGLRDLIATRDQTCRTPWCGAPIRHHDHVVPHDADGPTSEANLQGLCERCNHAKQAPRWRSRPEPGPRHTVEITTPTGHTYRSTAPPPPCPTPTWQRAGPSRWVLVS